MARLGGALEVTALDPVPQLDVVPVLVAGHRALMFVGGVVRRPAAEEPADDRWSAPISGRPRQVAVASRSNTPTGPTSPLLRP
jgi:hypothetical protein